MKRVRITLCLLISAAIATIGLASRAAAQIVVVGTGDPDVDVPAVQAAVDQGGDIILKGHFSFNRAPTVPMALGGLATVLVSKAVAISGAQDQDEDGARHGREHGEMTTIEGGTTPFYVEAPGASVAIQGLRFIRPKGNTAIFVYAVSGLVIASCKIEGLEPITGVGGGIDIVTVKGLPSPTNPGKPENISGTLLIANNDIDLAGGTALANMLGIIVFSVGVPAAEVDLYISGNTIRNNTERAINLYQVGGRAYIEDNVITTSTILGTANIIGCRGTDVIHVTGTGAYLVARNSIHSRWAAAGGIRVDSQAAVWPIINAIVVDNEVDMQAPEGTIFDRCSAGISIFGSASGSVVLNNRIRGRARAALALLAKAMGPANSALVRNRLDDFQASVADVVVEEGVMDTRIMGPGIIEDHGVGTVIVRRRSTTTKKEETRTERSDRRALVKSSIHHNPSWVRLRWRILANVAINSVDDTTAAT